MENLLLFFVAFSVKFLVNFSGIFTLIFRRNFENLQLMETTSQGKESLLYLTEGSETLKNVLTLP
jgi:hypothetical protein